MAGEEVLIADASPRDRAGLSALAEKLGLLPSAVDSAHLAREKIAGKFFAVAVVDLDLPGGGVDVLEFARERSVATQLVATTARKNYDAAVHAFRLGAVDVVFKRPDEVSRIEHGIATALDRYHASAGRGMRDVLDLLNELTRTIVALGRQVYAGEIDSLTQVSATNLTVLFVDDDGMFLRELSAKVARLPMDAYVEMSGGGALDKLGEHRFDVVVAKQGLSDLPGAIVVNAAQQRNPECIGLVYGAQGPGGRIERVGLEGRVTDTYTPFASAQHVADRVQQLVDEENARRRERRVLQVIGSKHGELLRKYADVKRRLEALG